MGTWHDTVPWHQQTRQMRQLQSADSPIQATCSQQSAMRQQVNRTALTRAAICYGNRNSGATLPRQLLSLKTQSTCLAYHIVSSVIQVVRSACLNTCGISVHGVQEMCSSKYCKHGNCWSLLYAHSGTQLPSVPS